MKITTNLTYLVCGIAAGLALAYFYGRWKAKQAPKLGGKKLALNFLSLTRLKFGLFKIIHSGFASWSSLPVNTIANNVNLSKPNQSETPNKLTIPFLLSQPKLTLPS